MRGKDGESSEGIGKGERGRKGGGKGEMEGRGKTERGGRGEEGRMRERGERGEGREGREREERGEGEREREREREGEHTSELQSRPHIAYAVFCVKKKKKERKENLFHICDIWSPSRYCGGQGVRLYRILTPCTR